MNVKTIIPITIIIVTYNSEKYITKCIESINSSIPKNWVYKIIVIDNHSQDQTITRLREIRLKYQNLDVIKNDYNVGFASAVNTGIERAPSKSDILLINPDTKVIKGSLSRLVNNARKNQADICGGKMLRGDGTTHGSYVKKPSIGILLFDFTNLRKLIPNDYWHRKFYYRDIIISHPTEVDAVSGGYMLIKRSVMDTIGLFDPNYFMYLEDIDYCIRAKDKQLKVLYDPCSPIYHIGGASSNNRVHTNLKAWDNSRKYYVKKHVTNIFLKIFVLFMFALDNRIVILWNKLRYEH